MSEPFVPTADVWVFRCPECGREWVNPDAPVTACFDGHPETDVDVVARPPEGDTSPTFEEGDDE
jgi:hypothetical protein